MPGKVQLTEQSTMTKSVKPVLVGTIIGIIVCVIFMLLFSLIITVRNVPQSMVSPMATFAVSAGALLSGFCCARITRNGGLAYGALCGCVMSAVVMIVGLFADGAPGLPMLFKFVFIMLCAMIGGVLGINTKRHRR